MFAILHVLWIFVADTFKSRRRLEAGEPDLRELVKPDQTKE
jgi:hypothetical protein